ncbi:IS4 family transposase [Parvibaculum sedimenti]|uniref:IS4 family transposase n=2 Tax=Parvibaculum sedimenti TaxID=2608632 RepID=A0A6N6VCD8_9HYPH|nr:IS4 family transposase [Parvibaculum sedimenti]
MKTMNLTTLTDKIQSIFAPKTLFSIARSVKLVERSRQFNPYYLLLAVIDTLGCQSKANLADIHRKYQTISGMPIRYKPFHNQLKKEQCRDFMQQCFEMVMQHWALHTLKLTSLSTGYAFPFSQVKLHDGCSFQLHDGLQTEYPGRFKNRYPAAVELHVTMDLLSSSVDYLALGADTEPERPHAPKAQTLNDTLLLTDAGYFDRDKIAEIDKNGGYTITQALCSINPVIKSAYDYQGNAIKKAKGKKLKTLQLKDKNTIIDLTAQWDKNPFEYRVIAFWYKKKKRVGYLVTNLSRETIPASDVVELYRLRWQIELLFKELKSYCNLKKFSTQKEPIVCALIYASFITVLLKRMMAFATEALKSLWISTQKVARSAPIWLSLLVNKLSQHHAVAIAVEECVELISKLCPRAHPKRDLKDGLYQFGVTSLVENNGID